MLAFLIITCVIFLLLFYLSLHFTHFEGLTRKWPMTDVSKGLLQFSLKCMGAGEHGFRVETRNNNNVISWEEVFERQSNKIKAIIKPSTSNPIVS